MAFEVPGPAIPFKAGADLSAGQHLFVSLDGNGDVVVSGAGARSMGVLQNKPTLGQGCDVVDRGVSKVVAGAAVAINDRVSADAAGKGVTSAAGNSVEGRALTAASAADEIISVKLDNEGLQA